MQVPQEEEVVETAEVVETEAVTRGVETGTVPGKCVPATYHYVRHTLVVLV